MGSSHAPGHADVAGRPVAAYMHLSVELPCSRSPMPPPAQAPAPGEHVTVPPSLRYGSDDPYAATFAFRTGTEEPVTWTSARDLLADGVLRPTGGGDIRFWPCGAGHRMVLDLALSSPAGRARLAAPLRVVADRPTGRPTRITWFRPGGRRTASTWRPSPAACCTARELTSRTGRPVTRPVHALLPRTPIGEPAHRTPRVSLDRSRPRGRSAHGRRPPPPQGLPSGTPYGRPRNRTTTGTRDRDAAPGRRN
ncbi:SsgA family sporulation/cell division regulator [Streptomyces sp. NPDC002476]|uniref:SsgA family sporulation/cell division regulator n=1 Tax=Streptomyces sp. NPDC002476 TaxID=3364648 RepID=UPI003696CF26